METYLYLPYLSASNDPLRAPKIPPNKNIATVTASKSSRMFGLTDMAYRLKNVCLHHSLMCYYILLQNLYKIVPLYL